jgi:hypothetical protein
VSEQSAVKPNGEPTRQQLTPLQDAISFHSLNACRWSEEMTYHDAAATESSGVSPSLEDQRRLYRLAIATYGLKERYFSHITGEYGDD